MEMRRFRKILNYSREQRAEMEYQLRYFYSCIGMEYGKEFLNLMQIARSFFAKKGYYVVEMPLKDKEIGALCYKGDAKGYVFLNSSLPKANVNFALCHEIYHVFFGKDGFSRPQMELYFSEHYFEQDEELAANLFAGMLLMPEQSFRSMYDKFLQEEENKEQKLNILVRLMNYYGAPYMAVLIRCYELELLEAGETLENLMETETNMIFQKFSDLWLDGTILESTKKDDYGQLRRIVAYSGKLFEKEGYLKEQTLKKALQNMQTLYEKIKGE